MRRVAGVVLGVLVAGAVVALRAQTPIGLPEPVAADLVALGRRLFFDAGLSSDRTVSCATCHDPAKGFADGRKVARGVGGVLGSRNTPSIINTGVSRSWFWDGRAATLEEQVLGPIANPKEMNLPLEQLEQRTGLGRAQVADALSAYLRTIRSDDSRYDRYGTGKRDEFTPDERAGLTLFTGRGNCTRCHGNDQLGDNKFHNTGVAWLEGTLVDEGRFAISGEARDHGAFKTPGLRDVALTAPYMHDGSVATLEAVITFYNDGGRANPHLDSQMEPLNLTAREQAQLVAFMKTLNGRLTEGRP